MFIIKGGCKEIMSFQSEESITNHDTYIKLEKVIQLVDTIISNNESSEEIQRLERFSEILNVLKEALDRVDPLLLAPNTLQSINGHITNILNHLTNFNSSKNIQHVTNAEAQLDNVIPILPQVMITRTPEDIEGVRKSVISFRISVGQHLSNVEKESIETATALTVNQGKLSELSNSIESQKTRLDAIISDFQEKFLKGQTERTEKADQIIKQTQNEFYEVLSEKEDSFDEQIEEQQKEHKAQINNHETEYEEQMGQQEEFFTEEYEKLKEMNNEAEKILGLMSMKGMAQGYQKIANDEGKKAFWWSMGSVTSLLAVIGLVIYFILRYEGIMEWTDLISRLVLTGTGITLFTYCAKQSTYHRIEERRNRKNELELASLDPYLKDMEEPDQKKVKESLVNKYFGVELPNQKGQEQNIVDTVKNNPQLIEYLTEKVSQQMSKK